MEEQFPDVRSGSILAMNMQFPDFVHRANADYLEQLHAQYDRDPQSLGSGMNLSDALSATFCP